MQVHIEMLNNHQALSINSPTKLTNNFQQLILQVNQRNLKFNQLAKSKQFLTSQNIKVQAKKNPLLTRKLLKS